MIGQIDPEPQADAEARVHVRSRSRAAARACRSASATSTRAGTRPSTTSASARRAARRAARSTTSRNPGYGIGKTPIQGPVPDGAEGGQRLRRRSSSSCASATRTTGRPRRASCSAACMATTAVSRARTKTAAPSPNVSRYYDSLFLSFDQKGNEAIGRLNTDRPVQFKLQGSYTHAVGHQPRRELPGVVRAAPVVDGDLPGRADLLQRPWRPRSHADAQPDRPADRPRLQDRAAAPDDRPPGEHHQPVRPGDGRPVSAFAAYRDALVIPGLREPAGAMRSSSPAASTRWRIQAARLPASGRPSPTYKPGRAFQGARSIRVVREDHVLTRIS